MLRTKLMAMLSARHAYQRLQYIESTGTQGIWLNTIIPDDNLETRITFQLTNLNFDWNGKRCVISKFEGNNKRYRPLIISNSKRFTVQNSNGTEIYSLPVDLKKHTIIYNGKNHLGSFDSNAFGSAIATSLTGHDDVPLAVFCQGQYSTAAGAVVLTPDTFVPVRIYELQFYNNKTNEKTGDFIPCLDRNEKPCLYDMVSRQAFYNSGTGEFLYGKVIT